MSTHCCFSFPHFQFAHCHLRPFGVTITILETLSFSHLAFSILKPTTAFSYQLREELQHRTSTYTAAAHPKQDITNTLTKWTHYIVQTTQCVCTGVQIVHKRAVMRKHIVRNMNYVGKVISKNTIAQSKMAKILQNKPPHCQSPDKCLHWLINKCAKGYSVIHGCIINGFHWRTQAE